MFDDETWLKLDGGRGKRLDGMNVSEIAVGKEQGLTSQSDGTNGDGNEKTTAENEMDDVV